MEFWGVEVKPGPVKCDIEEGKLLHLSQVKAIMDSIVAEEAALKKAAVSGKKRPTESASKTSTEKKAKLFFPVGQKTGKNVKKEQAKMKAMDQNDKDGPIAFIRNMFGYNSNFEDSDVDDDKDGVDDEVKAILDSILEEEATLKKAAVSGKKRPTESASKTTATEKKAKLFFPAGQKTGKNVKKEQTKMKAMDENDKDGPIAFIRNMFGYNSNFEDSDVDDDKDGVDDEAAVSGKKRPTKSASKTTATEKKVKLISPAGQKTGKNVKEQAKMKAKDENYEDRGLAMIMNMFEFNSNVEDSDVDDDKDGVDDEVNVITRA